MPAAKAGLLAGDLLLSPSGGRIAQLTTFAVLRGVPVERVPVERRLH